MSTREIIGQQMHVQRKAQSALRTREIIRQKSKCAIRNREIIGRKIHLQIKEQNALRTRETIEHLVYLWNLQLQNFFKL